MARTQLSLATCNLYNINEPGLRIYSDSDGWSQEEYDKKIEWLSRAIRTVDAHVWGFQELWHHKSLENIFDSAGLSSDYELLVPSSHEGEKIICAGAVQKDYLVGEPEWIVNFPEKFILSSKGDDPQTPDIAVSLDSFSRPVLHFKIKPRSNGKTILVYVAHLKSKMPTRIDREAWFRDDRDFFKNHRTGIGAAISTIRRTAEAAALRMMLTEIMKNTNKPVIVMGDLNDNIKSNTLNIISEQPNYLMGLSTGGTDVGLYSAGTLQQYRSERNVYYTHIHQNSHESLDHILVSEEFYDNSQDRIWAFKGTEILNDHLNTDDHKENGSTDHGIVKATFEYRPAR